MDALLGPTGQRRLQRQAGELILSMSVESIPESQPLSSRAGGNGRGRAQFGGAWRRAAQRVLFGIISALAAMTIVFLISRLAGDPAVLLSPPGADAGYLEKIRHELGLSDPIVVQYLRFIGDVFQGDLGESYYYREGVLSLITSHLAPTLILAISATLFATIVGVTLGLLAAFRQGGVADRVLGLVTMLGQAVPSFWLGPMLILIFAVWIPVFPATGMAGFGAFVLPTISLGALQLAVFFRITRSSSIEALGQDYVRIAKAKGIDGWRLAIRHVLPTTALPLLTVGGMGLATLIGGAVVVETIFGWAGIGSMMVHAVNQRDFPVVQGVALVFALAYIFLNTIVELLYPIVDPRLRIEAER